MWALYLVALSAVVRGANQIKVKVVNKDPGYKLGVYYEKTDEETDLAHEFLIQICEPFGDHRFDQDRRNQSNILSY